MNRILWGYESFFWADNEKNAIFGNIVKMPEIWEKYRVGRPGENFFEIIFEKALDFLKLSAHTMRAFKLRPKRKRNLNP